MNRPERKRARQFFWLAGLVGLAVAGCSRGRTHADIFRDQIKAHQEVAEVLRSVKGPSGMDAARTALKARYAHVEALTEEAAGLPEPLGQARKELEPLALQLQEAREALLTEVRRINGLPGGPAFFESLRVGPGSAPRASPPAVDSAARP